MHAKSAEGTQFLERDLLPQVKAAFAEYKSADKAAIGTGKTMLATALGVEAAKRRKSNGSATHGHESGSTSFGAPGSMAARSESPAKCNTPIATHLHCPGPFSSAPQFVQSKAGQAHVAGLGRHVQGHGLFQAACRVNRDDFRAGREAGKGRGRFGFGTRRSYHLRGHVPHANMGKL